MTRTEMQRDLQRALRCPGPVCPLHEEEGAGCLRCQQEMQEDSAGWWARMRVRITAREAAGLCPICGGICGRGRTP